MEACACAGPPVASDYTPVGEIVNIDNVQTYVVGSSERAIVIIYDIFGFHNNTKQFCDKLSEMGFTVAMADHFRGEPWSLENFPPADFAAFQNWVAEKGSWDIVKTDLLRTVEHLREAKGCSKFGVLGFCWGGRNAMQAAAEPTFSACGTAHPAFLQDDYAEAAQAPLIFLPSGDDPPTDSIQAILDGKPFGDKCVYRRFDDMHHGWCAARGDWAVPLQAQRASEALQLFGDFYKANL
ncbi:unnamed protein product [Heterosigma akashiwo]